MRGCVSWWDGFTVRTVDPYCATQPWTNQMSACECWTLTPLCEGHPEVLRWLVEGPELGVSPFPCILMGSVGVLSVVCSVTFKVLCRSTKAGPSAPLVSPPSSLKSWTGPPSRQKTWWMKPNRSRRDETWWVWTEKGWSWGGQNWRRLKM